ncbi:MAG TPA: glycosyltransferase family 2 protein [Gammaproteobacteria bacterium]|nr:glycosyltransferase family 2 protein [Gammaproteobacteria bacterium]
MSINATPKVNILLSTYNGERFIVEQLDSLFHQTYFNIAIHIRDDGSTDSTVGLINACSTKNKPVVLTSGNNIGVIPSFLRLLASSGSPGDLYAFCDQDDVWKPEKIARAVEQIMKRPEPDRVLYCTRLEYVDEHLKHLGYSLIPRYTGFSNAVVENIATGCTLVFGEKIRQLILDGAPCDMIMHDWWGYLAASVFGDVVYDDFPSIQYRQHGNTFTAWEPGFTKLRTRACEFMIRMKMREHKGLDSLNQAIHFLEDCPDIPNDAKKVVDTLLSLREDGKTWQRVRYVMHPEVLRTDSFENLALKAMILFGLH